MTGPGSVAGGKEYGSELGLEWGEGGAEVAWLGEYGGHGDGDGEQEKKGPLSLLE